MILGHVVGVFNGCIDVQPALDEKLKNIRVSKSILVLVLVQNTRRAKFRYTYKQKRCPAFIAVSDGSVIVISQ